MILVVDNNEERRKNIITWLKVKGYMASGTNFSELPYYTLPFMTVYISPTLTETNKIKYNSDTISVFVSERPSVKIPTWDTRCGNRLL